MNRFSFCALLALLALLPRAFGQSRLEEFAAQSKHPAPWLTWGGDLRLRNEYYRDTNMRLSAANEFDLFRFRARVWTSVAPLTNLNLNARLTWESRYYARPEAPISSGRFQLDAYEPDEAILDNFNLRLAQLWDQPLSLTVGRQDLFLGNGWFVGDGTPRDGSRTMFFDAARLVYEPAGWHTSFNLIGIDQSAESDAWLPPINGQDYRRVLTEQNEHAVLLYAINQSLPQTRVDGYFVYCQEDNVAGIAGSADADIYAFGARVLTSPTPHWELRAECLPEFGHKNGQDLHAFGANSLLTYRVQDAHNQRWRLGYEFLGGDDQSSTGTNERFDPLWGRWPQFSELLLYNPTVGPRPFEWGNYHRLNAGWSVSPLRRWEFSADYHALWAVENEPFTVGGQTYQTTGHFRGHLATALLEYTHSRQLKGHIRAEMFFPGDYYRTEPAGPERDMEVFLRGEIYLTW